MSKILLNLIVIRTPNVVESVAFYTKLGLKFTLHQHGAGTPHHASENANIVLEIYPSTASQPPTTQLRLGFRIGYLVEILAKLPHTNIIASPKTSEWGLRAVVQDPDGNKVELVQDSTLMTQHGT